jgi:hypothetical protein
MNMRNGHNFRFLLTLLLVTGFLLTNFGAPASKVYAQDVPSDTPTAEPQPTQTAEQPTLEPTQAPAVTETPVAQPIPATIQATVVTDTTISQPTLEPTQAPVVTQTPVPPAAPAVTQTAPVEPLVKKAPIVKINDYLSIQTLSLANGVTLIGTDIGGPPVPPPGTEAQRTVAEVVPQSAMTLPKVPAFTWVLGCSAVSSAMIAGYYDNSGYPNMYTGATNGGVMPSNDSSWSHWTDVSGRSYPNNPLIASHNGSDGRISRGTVDDYWVKYFELPDSPVQDPFITNGWAQHTWGTAIGDYMKTSQSNYYNTDGSTMFYNYYPLSSKKLTCSDMKNVYGVDINDGTYGRKLFYEARGYTVTDCYNQNTDNKISGGFSLANYKSEIDAGHPVLLNLAGHSIVGYGYDSTSSTIYIHDTWDLQQHSMTWGGSYSDMELLSVSIVNLVSLATPPALISPSGDITASQPAYKWRTVSGATGYQLKVTNTDTSAIMVNKAVSTSACSGGVCSTTPSVSLTGVNYKFEVATKNSSGMGSYSTPMTFREIRHFTPATAPALVSPSGPIWVLKPTYRWNPLLAATGYVIKVTNNDTLKVVVNSSVSTSVCGSTSCSYTPSVSLADGNYQFEVAAKNSYGQGPFGGPMTFQDFYHTPPNTPSLISPSGAVYVQKPPYKWTPSARSTGYVLKVTNTDNGVVVVNASVSTSVCKSTACSYTPSVSLYGGNYKFEVAAKNSYGQSALSAPMTFLAGFNSSFNGSSTGWKAQAGGGWSTSSYYYYTSGSFNKWSTARYNGTYTNFDFSAQLKRKNGVYFDGTNYWAPANAIFVRQGASFSSTNEWYPGYMFAYYDWGSLGHTPAFAIWRYEANGTYTIVVFANTNAVVPNGWNVLRITATGGTFNFYINDVSVYGLTDASFSRGSVGVGMQKISTASTTYYVNWATLGQYVSGVLSNAISASQQTLNAEGQNVPAGYIFPEKIKYFQP